MPQPPQRPEPGTPEYNWLYGESGEPEPTRVMPAVGSPRKPPPQPGARPPAGPPQGGPPPARRLPRFPLRRFRLRWLLLVLVAWLVFLIAVPIIAFQRVTTLDDAFPTGDRPDEQEGTTYLVVGSDKADDLTEQQRKDMRTGPRSAGLTDTIMLLHIGDGPNLLMSIPRDSKVDVPGHGSDRNINSAFSLGGPALLVRTIEKNTGIRIDNYVELGFGSVINVVDAIGGVEICPKRKMVDKRARLDIKKGCQEVDGMTALAYSRSRHASKYSDLGRVGQQREVVSAIGSEVVSPGTVLIPWRYWNLNMAGAESVRVSEGTGPIDLARFAWAMTHVDGKDGLTCTVPVEDFAVNWDPERSRRMFRHIREDDTEGIPKSLCTTTGLPKSTTG